MKMQKLINGGKELLVVRVVLEDLSDNAQPYFSIQGTIYKANKKGERDARYRDCLACGMLHDVILEAFPELADVVALHVAHMDGTPTYAMGNGWYFVEKKDVEALAKLLRISQAEAERLTHVSKDAFESFVTSQVPRWNAEATAAIEKYHIEVVKG